MEPYEWIWDVGDGTTSEEFELVHSYDDPGIYDISLIGLSPMPLAMIQRQLP
jgi:PKD repeat protein